jgi:ABC-type nickel/cobalt efflux system permease component RcnA
MLPCHLWLCLLVVNSLEAVQPQFCMHPDKELQSAQREPQKHKHTHDQACLLYVRQACNRQNEATTTKQERVSELASRLFFLITLSLNPSAWRRSWRGGP